MKKHHNAAGAIALSGVLALSLAACGSTSGSSPTAAAAPLSLAYVYGNASDPFWTSISCGAQTEAKALGVDLKVYSNPDLDATKLQQSLDAALLQSPKGLMVNPLNPNQFVAQFQDKMNAGVPVVSNQATQPPATLSTVWSSGEAKGFLDDVLKLLPTGAGKVAVLGGVQGLAPVESRYFPLVDAIKQARPDLTFLETQYSGFDPLKAQSAIASLLIAHPDLNTVIAATGPDGQGAAAAVKAANAGNKISVFTFDATPSNVDGLKAGDFKAIISQNPYEIGKQQVDKLVDYLKKNTDGSTVKPTDENVGIPQGLLTAQNVTDPKNKTYIYTAACS